MPKKIGIIGLVGSVLYGGGLLICLFLVAEEAIAGTLRDNTSFPPQAQAAVLICAIGLVLIGFWALLPGSKEEEPSGQGPGR